MIPVKSTLKLTIPSGSGLNECVDKYVNKQVGVAWQSVSEGRELDEYLSRLLELDVSC